MAQNRPRAASDSARLRDRLMSICQGCASGQIDTDTIILEQICTAEGQQRCLFDALPAGRLRGDFFRQKHRKKTSEAGRADRFIITRQVRPRDVPCPCPPPPADTCCAKRSTLSTVWFTAPPWPESSTCLVREKLQLSVLGSGKSWLGQTGRGKAHATRCSVPDFSMRLSLPACLSC